MPHLVPRPTILQTAESILRIERSKWIYHDRALAKSLGLSIEILRGFVKSIGSSGGGPPPYDAAIDLNSGEDNILNLYRLQHGKKMTHAIDSEEPSLDHAVTGLNTYYQIGRKEIRDKRINIKVQIDLIKMVTGTHAALDQFGGEYKTKRQEIWKDWIEGSNPVTSALYEHDHLPYIVLHYYRYWDVTIPPNTTVTTISSAVLELVKQEIVDLLVKMFVIPSSAMEQFSVLRRSTRNSVDMEIEPTNSRKRKHSPISEDNSTSLDDDDDYEEEETESGADGNDDLTKAMSKQLDKGELKKLWTDGEYKRVGCLEIAAKEEDEILKYFVLANNSSLLGDIQKKIDDHRKLLHSVFSVAAKQISPFYKKLLDKSSTHANDEMWGSGGGEDANTQTDTDADAGADTGADVNTTNNTVTDEDVNNNNNT